MKNKEIKEKIKAYYIGNDIDELLDHITNLEQKINQYENPDDMILFYMWLDEKAKDKMKQLKQENERLKEQLEDETLNKEIAQGHRKQVQDIELQERKELEDYKSRIDIANILLKLLHYKFADNDSIHYEISDIENILTGDDEE